MDLFRPHVLTFTTPGTPATDDPVTGYPIPGEPEQQVSIRCRFVPNKTARVFKNANNEDVQQKGRIRVPIGSIMPTPFAHLVVTEGERVHFTGPALEVYTGGHLTGWRIDV